MHDRILSANQKDCKTRQFLACMVCGSPKLGSLYSVKDTNQDALGEWEIVACQDCRTGVLSPFPDDVSVASFYQDVFYTPEGKRFRGWMEVVRGFFSRLRGRRLNQLKPFKGKLLDFGSGAGHFADSQIKVGWQVQAIDLYSSASSDANYCRITEDGFELLYPDGYFDAITLWYVIEHLRNPRGALSEFSRVLKPGGILVLAQQDFASIQARIFGSRWLYLDPPRHLWQFSADSLTMLCEQYGLGLVNKSWANIEMGPFCMLQSMLNIIVGNNNDLFRFLKNKKLSEVSLKNAKNKLRFWPTAISIALLPILGPVVIMAYFILLLFNSGDVVTLYFKKPVE